jgi:hypothetical protein
MRRTTVFYFVILMLFSACITVTAQSPELVKLREQYKAATREYKTSLLKLRDLYQESLKRSIERQERTKKLFDEGLLSDRDVTESERLVQDARLKIAAVNEQIQNADQQIAAALTDVDLEKAYKAARAEEVEQRRRAISRHLRPPAPCHDWMLRSDRDQSLGGVTKYRYTVICGSHRTPK